MGVKTEVFILFEKRDRDLFLELKGHLAPLEKQGLITLWDEDQIVGGSNRRQEIDSHLQSAPLVLLLISARFMASNECYKLAKQALATHTPPRGYVVPVLLHEVDWEHSDFGPLQPLPADEKPISSWTNRHAAFLDVVKGVRAIVENYKQSLVPLLVSTTQNKPDEMIGTSDSAKGEPESFDVFLDRNSEDKVPKDEERLSVSITSSVPEYTRVNTPDSQPNYLLRLSKLARKTTKDGFHRDKPIIPIFLYSTVVLLFLLNIFLLCNILDLVIFLKRLMRVNPVSLRLTAVAALIIIIGAMIYDLLSILGTKMRSQSAPASQDERAIRDGTSWYRKALVNVVSWSRKALAYRVIICICFLTMCIPLSFWHSSAVETGVGLLSDNPRIGVCDGFCPLDTDRLTGKLKQQAASYFQQKQDAPACQYLQWAALGDITGPETINKELNDHRSQGEDTTDAEAKIAYEDRCTNMQCPCISFVVTVQFTDQGDLNSDYINGVSRSILQGAYLQQKKWNESHANPPMYLFIANISAGDPAQPEIQQAQQEVADQILGIQQRDQEHIIVGAIGLPFGVNTISKLNDAHIPMVSTAPVPSSDSQAYLFSVAPSLNDEVNAMVKFCSGFQKIAYYSDQNDAYNQKFNQLFQASLINSSPLPYGDLTSLANQVAASDANLIIFIGPVGDTANFLLQLRKVEKDKHYQSHTVLARDNLYQWVYKHFEPNERSAFDNVYFVAFAYPDANQLLNDPGILDDFNNTFDPGAKRSGNIYTYRRASSDAILAYDALALLLNAQKNTTCAISCDARVWGSTLQHYMSTTAFKGASGQISFKSGSSVPDSKSLFFLLIQNEKNGNPQYFSGRY